MSTPETAPATAEETIAARSDFLRDVLGRSLIMALASHEDPRRAQALLVSLVLDGHLRADALRAQLAEARGAHVPR